MEKTDAVTHEFLRNFSVNDFLPENIGWNEIPRKQLLVYVNKLKTQLPKILQEDPLVMSWLYRTYDLHEEANEYQAVYNNEILKTLQEYEKLNPSTT